MEDNRKSLAPIFQVTNPNYGKSPSETLLQRIQKSNEQNYMSQLAKAQDIEAKLANTPKQQKTDLTPFLMAADFLAPGKNMAANYQMMQRNAPDERAQAEKLLQRYREGAAKSGQALLNSLGGNGQDQASLANLRHKNRMEQIRLSSELKGSGKPQLRQLSANMVKNINEGNAIPAMLDDVNLLIESNQDMFNPLVGKFRSMNPYDEGAQSMEADLRARSQSFGRFMEGGVLRKEDEAKYKRMFPKIGDTPEVARRKLKTVRRLLIQKQNSDLEAFRKQGFDVSGLDKGFELPELEGVDKAPLVPNSVTDYSKMSDGDFESISDEEIEKAYLAKIKGNK